MKAMEMKVLTNKYNLLREEFANMKLSMMSEGNISHQHRAQQQVSVELALEIETLKLKLQAQEERHAQEKSVSNNFARLKQAELLIIELKAQVASLQLEIAQIIDDRNQAESAYREEIERLHRQH